jgi:hypothetical protein
MKFKSKFFDVSKRFKRNSDFASGLLITNTGKKVSCSGFFELPYKKVFPLRHEMREIILYETKRLC